MNIQGIGQSLAASQQYSSIQNTRNEFEMPPDAETIIANEDTDQDGFLSISETMLNEEMFSDADTDSDGLLSVEELEEMLASTPPPPQVGGMGGPPPGPMSIEELFEEEDTDGDDAISLEESRLSEEMFSNIDADGDGYITAEEIEESLTPESADGTDARSGSSGISYYESIAMNAYQNMMDSFISGNSETSLFQSGSDQKFFI